MPPVANSTSCRKEGVAMSLFLRVLALSGCLIVPFAPTAAAFETSTHAAINQGAARASTLDGVLKDELGFLSGLITPLIDRRTPIDWIGLGGLAEDHYLGSEILGSLTRSVNHFHQPLRSWNNAGFLRTSEASVRGAQTPPQSPGGRAWGLDARAAFHRALPTANLGERQQAFADAFRSLGQVMHLVADMASVPHTRDDSHLLGDGFERFMGDRRNAGLIGGVARPPPGPGPAATGEAVARGPNARPRGSHRHAGTHPPGQIGRAHLLTPVTSLSRMP